MQYAKIILKSETSTTDEIQAKSKLSEYQKVDNRTEPLIRSTFTYVSDQKKMHHEATINQTKYTPLDFKYFEVEVLAQIISKLLDYIIRLNVE